MLVAVLIPAPQARSALHTPGRPGYRAGRTGLRTDSAKRVGASTSGGLPVRKVTFGGANSLDNYLARPDHA
jgi:hypothetical protein